MPFVRTQLPSGRQGPNVGRFGPGGFSRAGIGGAVDGFSEEAQRRMPVLIGAQHRGDASAQRPPVFISPRFRLPAAFRLTGTTRDSAGAPLGGCAVHLFNSADVEIAETVSDGGGAFSFLTDQNSGTYYLVAYLPGSPDRAGTSANTLTLDYVAP